MNSGPQEGFLNLADDFDGVAARLKECRPGGERKNQKSNDGKTSVDVGKEFA